MMKLTNVKDVESFRAAIARCRGDVILRSTDGWEEFNLRSALSEYVAIGRLCDEHGDDYEIFCMNPADEQYLLAYFFDKRHS